MNWGKLLTFVVLGLLAGCDGTSSSSDCPIGSEGCACTEGGVCDGTLSCFSGHCVNENGMNGDVDNTSDTNTSDTNTSDTNTSDTNTSDTNTSDRGADLCVEAGGTINREGACVKACERDTSSPGNDLWGDCSDLRMKCSRDDFCVPDDQCSSDADCTTDFGADYMCVWFSSRPSLKSCHPPCGINGDCPAGSSCDTSDIGEGFGTGYRNLQVCH